MAMTTLEVLCQCAEETEPRQEFLLLFRRLLFEEKPTAPSLLRSREKRKLSTFPHSVAVSTTITSQRFLGSQGTYLEDGDLPISQPQQLAPSGRMSSCLQCSCPLEPSTTTITAAHTPQQPVT
ncbi:hypothetical protein MLD38_037554 [Melastoma candidum]|uniref:Uncharacterized protein n=1 Tax=Melastoma candidum TaxID=119954 RepID=A0ACB9LNQ1_9MYRT|nr:hypothetical protein MLD38_037554 [Melastoma candidum]